MCRAYVNRVTGNESVPKIITNNAIFFFLKPQSAFWKFQTITVSECCLIKLLPYILLEKYINTSALELANLGNRHCANCIGAFSFLIVDHLFNAPNQFAHWWYTSTTIFPEHIYQHSTQKGVMMPMVRSIFP